MRPHKNARSAYENPQFRKAMVKRGGASKLDAMIDFQESQGFSFITTEFDRLEQDRFKPHPIEEGRTVVIRDMPPDWGQIEAMSSLAKLLQHHKLTRISSGWVHEGYAVVFRTARAASQFRLIYPGQTSVPQ